jgi:NAD(P)-dependent dehydrogenase (short-subunit alcohol dehydrogenase family)
MRYNFSDMVVLITGGTGALGKTLVKKFIATGATIIVTYNTDKKVADLRHEIKETDELELFKTDITKEDQIAKLISDIVERYGHLDILVNVVGGYLGGKSVAELSESEWDIMMNMNLKSAFLISKHTIPVMKSRKYVSGGKIVHISSRTGLKAGGYDSAYAASKSGLIRLVESISQETKEHNINVNCILPSIIDTESNRKAMPEADFSKWIKAEDLTNVILFLCSDESKVITGAAIPAYGLS